MQNVIIKSSEIFERIGNAFSLRNDAEIARALRVAPKKLAVWKLRNTVPYDTLIAFCRGNGLRIDWVLTGEGPMNRDYGVSQLAAGNGIIQGHKIETDEIHIDIHQPGGKVTEHYERYIDPVQEAFLKDWLSLSDVGKMRVWTLLKEEIAKEKEG